VFDYTPSPVTVLVSPTEVDCFLWKGTWAPEVRTRRLTAWASHDLRGSKVATAERDQPHDIPATFTGGTVLFTAAVYRFSSNWVDWKVTETMLITTETHRMQSAWRLWPVKQRKTILTLSFDW